MNLHSIEGRHFFTCHIAAKMYFGKLNVCRVTHTARKSIYIKQDKIQQIKGYRGIISKCTDIHALLLCKQGEKY